MSKTEPRIHPLASDTSHTQLDSHDIDLQAARSNPLSIGEVGTTLTNAQKDFVLARLHFDALDSFEDLPPQATFVFEKIEEMKTEEAIKILQEAVKEHNDDINISDEDLDLWKKLINYKEPKQSFKDKLRHFFEKSKSKEKTEELSSASDVEVEHQQVSDSQKKPSSEKQTHSNEKEIKQPSEQAGHANVLSEVNEHKLDTHEIVDWNLQVRLEAVIIAYWSPYPQVRAVTDPFDDPTIPVETLRMYIISIVW
ncbi:hypothetical protein KGF57_001294, partial [Candida theae]